MEHDAKVDVGHSLQGRDWGHLPAVAVQTLGKHCCPASKAKLRQVCSSWHTALATQFTEMCIGPSSPWPGSAEDEEAAAEQHVAAAQRSFPAVTTVHVTASSTRDYPATYTQGLSHLLCSLPGVVNLSLQELHELEDFDNLDLASLWDALEASLPCLGHRLVGLNVSDCFWNDAELFNVLRHLTALTQLKLANNPLEAACEVGIIASMSQLRVLEFGLIFDGASQHHDVPRALEAIGDLQQLQELSLPMWRRSLGGRAHPLAPSLSAALGRLTRLTSLAVDGKFGHLRVVSTLTNLQRLASAAPLSVEGWQAISQLPQLTLLTSLTPASEPMRLNTAQPHLGLDLALLVTKASLVGLDVGVMQPEHLATIGQFTRLQRLTLRCAASFQQPQQQAQLLTAFSCLPGGLTSLLLGPMLPLSAKLFTTIARSCPQLRALQARFTHVAACAGAPAAQLGSSCAGTGTQGAAPAVAGMEAVDDAAKVDSYGCDSLVNIDTEMDGVDDSVGLTQPMDGAATVAAAAAAAGPGSSSGAGAGGCNGVSISRSLGRFHGLLSLELVLHGWDDEEDEEAGHGSTGHGSAGALWPGVVGDKGRLAEEATAALASSSKACVQLLLEDLPRSLQQLVLTGPWLLNMASLSAAAAAAAEKWPVGGLSRRSSSSNASNKSKLLQQRQQQQTVQQQCSMCGRTGAGAAAAAPLIPAEAAVGAPPGRQGQLCECMKGLGRMKLSSPAASASAGPPLEPAAAAAARAGAAAGQTAAGMDAEQQQQQHGSVMMPAEPLAGTAAATAEWQPGASHVTSGPASPVLCGRQSTGQKRPGSHLALLAAAEAAGSAANSPYGGSGMDSEDDRAAAAAGDDGNLFMLEQWRGLEKRTRCSSSAELQPATDSASKHGVGAQTSRQHGFEEHRKQQDQQGSAAAAAARTGQQPLPLPVLSELSLFGCHVSVTALERLLSTAGMQLQKLQLLRVHTSSSAVLGRQQQAQSLSSMGAIAEGVVPSTSVSARSLMISSARAGQTQSRTAAWQNPAELTTQQLMALPVAWPHLQEWHLHPHQLWGLVRAGCLPAGPADPGTSIARTESSSSSNSCSAMQQRHSPGSGQLQHLSQLLNLRHLFVVNRPAAFNAAFPSVKERREGEAVTSLPLHHRPSMQALLVQLQAGLQQLPALRQLLLYMGHVAKEHPDLPDVCADVWTEAGERLLEVMPACKVKHYKPTVVAAAETAGLVATVDRGLERPADYTI